MALLGLVWLPFSAVAQEFKPPSNLKSPAMIAEGRAFFNRSCAGQCHGVDGQEGFEGPSLFGKAYLDPNLCRFTRMSSAVVDRKVRHAEQHAAAEAVRCRVCRSTLGAPHVALER